MARSGGRPTAPASRSDLVRFGVGLVALAIASVVAWALAWTVIAPVALGWSPVAVTSDSMAPSVDAGDIVFVESPGGRELETGSIIVFDDPAGRPVTHRIVGVTTDGDLVTRGDANARVDSTPVARDQVDGVGRMVIPKLGLPLVWLDDGRWAHLVVLALVIAATAWACRWGLLATYNPWRQGSERTVPTGPRALPDDRYQLGAKRETNPARA